MCRLQYFYNEFLTQDTSVLSEKYVHKGASTLHVTGENLKRLSSQDGMLFLLTPPLARQPVCDRRVPRTLADDEP
jgi:hypothetical protein